MKFSLLLALSIFTAPFAHAAADLRCTASLLHSTMADGSGGLWIPPAAGIVAFDMDPSKERMVWLKANLVVPTRGTDPAEAVVQYALQIGNEKEADYALEFTKKGFDGEPLKGRTLSFFVREVSAWNNPSWMLSNGNVLSSSMRVTVAGEVKGYLIVNCLKK